jgi:hypothetical protein
MRQLRDGALSSRWGVRTWCGQAVSGLILFLHDYNIYIPISVVNFIVSLGLQSEPSDRAILRSIW